MKRVHVFISGYVQGIGFRSFVKYNASKLGLKGGVKNTNDKVEAIFEGNEEAIQQMLEICKQGPRLSKVESLEVKEESYKEEFTKFSRKN